MKKLNLLLAGALLIGGTTLLNAQDKKAEPAKTDAKSAAAAKEATSPQMDEAAMMKKYAEYMTPGPAHEMMAKCNGDWKEEVTWWAAPGAPPNKSTSTCNTTMILGGRYQQSVTKGDMNGMPFEGISTVGYDNVLKIYQSTWVDNMGTGIMFMQGRYDEKTKTLTMRGKMLDPIIGRETMMRQTIKFIDDNNQLMEMYQTKNGKEFKNMEIKFTR